jgi:ATP-dependent exoDNAse (exonuclease V) beta subunit
MKPELNAAQTPLESGFTVIEASAGTGKTTTISAIVLRLLAEQGSGPKKSGRAARTVYGHISITTAMDTQ